MYYSNKGTFIISLDFELHWGAIEKWNIENKKAYFDSTRKTIPLILQFFNKYNIHATWATVGFLFAKSKEQLINFRPSNIPTYKNDELNYYNIINNNQIGVNEEEDPYHYAFSLISKIIKTQNQELSTHTFSHYYCNEKGQNIEQFDADLKAAQAIAFTNFNIELKSLVFPRNQFNNSYVAIAKKNGIKVVRSNPNVWFWNKQTEFSPLARAADTLMPISKSLSFENPKKQSDVLLLPASRFLRPYTNKEKLIQNLKLNRIKSEMTFAAKNNRMYHLWWHPHNFGNFPNENLIFLESILIHFNSLNKKYGFLSKNMIEMLEV